MSATRYTACVLASAFALAQLALAQETAAPEGPAAETIQNLPLAPLPSNLGGALAQTPLTPPTQSPAPFQSVITPIQGNWGLAGIWYPNMPKVERERDCMGLAHADPRSDQPVIEWDCTLNLR